MSELKDMRVKWTESVMNIDSLPEHYKKENLSLLDKNHEGRVIGSFRSMFFGITYLMVVCTDNLVRDVDASKVTVIGDTREEKEKPKKKILKDPCTNCKTRNCIGCINYDYLINHV